MQISSCLRNRSYPTIYLFTTATVLAGYLTALAIKKFVQLINESYKKIKAATSSSSKSQSKNRSIQHVKKTAQAKPFYYTLEIPDPHMQITFLLCYSKIQKNDLDKALSELWEKFDLEHQEVPYNLFEINNPFQKLIHECLQLSACAFGEKYEQDKNLKRATYYYKTAAHLGSIEALCKLGEIAEFEKDYKNALIYYVKAARKKCPQAWYNLGMLYLKKRNGFSPKPELALKFFKIASKLKHEPANQMISHLNFSLARSSLD